VGFQLQALSLLFHPKTPILLLQDGPPGRLYMKEIKQNLLFDTKTPIGPSLREKAYTKKKKPLATIPKRDVLAWLSGLGLLQLLHSLKLQTLESLMRGP